MPNDRIDKTRLTAATERPTRFPDLGWTLHDLPPGPPRHPVERHVPNGPIVDRAVTVVGVLHGKMDAPAHLTS
jgi:hypothetical protein